MAPGSYELPVGMSHQYVVYATYWDGTVENITESQDLTWQVESNEIVGLATQPGLVTGLNVGKTTVAVTMGSNGHIISAQAELSVTDAIVTDFYIEPALSTLPEGLSLSYQAIAVFSDGSVYEITTDPNVSWRTSDASIATVDPRTGVVTARSEGEVTVEASGTTNGVTYTASASLTVVDHIVTEMRISPVSTELPEGLTQAYQAFAVFTDGSVYEITTDPNVSWRTSDASIATVDPRTGVVTARSEGEVTVEASGTTNGVTYTASASLTVVDHTVTEMRISSVNSELPEGLTQAYQAFAVFSDGNVYEITSDPNVSWRTSDASIATVDPRTGVVTARSEGEVTVEASGTTNGVTYTASASLTVVDHIVTEMRISPVNSELPEGLTQAYQAFAVFSDGSVYEITSDPNVSWRTSDASVATVDPRTGVVTARSEGEVTVEASGTTNGVTYTASASLTVVDHIVIEMRISPVNSELPEGLTKAYQALAVFSDGSVYEITSDPNVSWRTSDASVATVDPRTGVVTARSEGEVTVEASGTTNGVTYTASASLTVVDHIVTEMRISPVNSELPEGLTQAYQAFAVFSDGSVYEITSDPNVSWRTSDASVATVDPRTGVVTARSEGEVIVEASGATNGITYSAIASLKVVGHVVVDLQVLPKVSELPNGLTVGFKAQALFSDGAVIDVTTEPALSWRTSDASVAVINPSSGILTAVSEGRVSVEAYGIFSDNRFSAVGELTVIAPELSSVQIVPATSELPKGLTLSYQAYALYSDGTTVEITSDPAVSWKTSDAAIATINTTSAELTAHQQGEVVVEVLATYQGKALIGTANLTVVEPVLEALLVSPEVTELQKGLTQNYQALAEFSDGTWLDVTTDPLLTWRTSDSVVASIEPKSGMLTALSEGATTVTAFGKVNGVVYSASAALTVTDSPQLELKISPPALRLPVGLTFPYQASVIFGDGTVVDVTNNPSVHWQVSDTSIAAIDSDTAIVSAIKEGSVTVEVVGKINGESLSASADLNVIAPVIKTLKISPAQTSLYVGSALKYSAEAVFSDGSTIDVTEEPNFSWTTSDSSIATINPATGTLSAISQGGVAVTVSGRVDGSSYSSSAALTVIAGSRASELRFGLENPKLIEMTVGDSRGFEAQLVFPDGDIVEVSKHPNFSWRSSNSSVAVVEPNSGVVSILSKGMAGITLAGEYEGIHYNGDFTILVF